MTSTLRLDNRGLDAAFPFHFIVDDALEILATGRVLRRLLPDAIETTGVSTQFECVRTASELTLEAITSDPERCWLLRAKQVPRLVLRGQFVPTADGTMLFVGGPRIDIDTLKELGLTLHDFAAHDAAGDYIFLVNAQQASLADAARLSDELGRLNVELEDRVKDRTHELSTANAQLMRTASDLVSTLVALEFANGRLELEKQQRERVEGELRLAHRLEAVGQLAAGIAHEINTPIQYVGDSLHFLRDAFQDLVPLVETLPELADKLDAVGETKGASDLRRQLDTADAAFLLEQVPKALERTFDGIDRVAKIVRAIKAFAHPGSDERSPADLNEALKTTLAVCKNEYKYVADVELDLGSLPPVPCLLGELNQVFLNLIVNAAHAVGDVNAGSGKLGTIRIRSRVEEGTAKIEIEDDGPGIPEEVKNRIFDPFFTTKPVGKGTGQGLTIARSIVTKHGGRLTFRSEPGKGTVFVVSLPLEEGATLCLQ